VNEVDLEGKVVHLTDTSNPERQQKSLAAVVEDTTSDTTKTPPPPVPDAGELLAKGLSELATVIGESQAAKVRVDGTAKNRKTESAMTQLAKRAPPLNKNIPQQVRGNINAG
jgi:hypothetical protein